MLAVPVLAVPVRAARARSEQEWLVATTVQQPGRDATDARNPLATGP